MSQLYGLSADDVTLLRDMLASYKQQRQRTVNRPFAGLEQDQYGAPEVYIALTPKGGIPGMVLDVKGHRPSDSGTGPPGTGSGTGSGSDIGWGNVPGYADCTIYRILWILDPHKGAQIPTLIPVPTNTRRVYNLSEAPIGGEEWTIVVRDKLGTWVTVPIPSELTSYDSLHHKGAQAGLERWYAAGFQQTLPEAEVRLVFEEQLFAIPMFSAEGGAVDAIGFFLDRPGPTGSLVKIGIYDSVSGVNGNLYPGKLLVESDEFPSDDWNYQLSAVKFFLADQDKGTGIGTGGGPGLFLRKGALYWFVVTFNSNTVGPPTGLTLQVTEGGHLPNGYRASFRVTAVKGDTETNPSAIISGEVVETGTGCDTGSGTTPGLDDAFLITWGAVAGATSYNIYKVSLPDGVALDGLWIANVSSASYLFTGTFTPITGTGAAPPPRHEANHGPPFPWVIEDSEFSASTGPTLGGNNFMPAVMGFPPDFFQVLQPFNPVTGAPVGPPVTDSQSAATIVVAWPWDGTLPTKFPAGGRCPSDTASFFLSGAVTNYGIDAPYLFYRYKGAQ